MKTFSVMAILAPFVFCGVLARAEAAALETVPSLDLSRYAGKWYEIARTPNRYEQDCAGDVVLQYNVLSDGKLGVRNECRKRDGTLDIAQGYAKQGASSAKLRVTFFWPFFFDYWVIDLDENYRYAVVGEPKKRDLWILCRTPTLEGATYSRIIERAARAGYNVSKLVRTEQSLAAQPPRNGRGI